MQVPNAPRVLAALTLAGAALLSAGASAQQASPQGSPPATGQTSCPAMAPGQQMNGMPMQGMPRGQMNGQMGGQMGAMSPQDMQAMHEMRTEIAGLRAEMKELREQLRRGR